MEVEMKERKKTEVKVKLRFLKTENSDQWSNLKNWAKNLMGYEEVVIKKERIFITLHLKEGLYHEPLPQGLLKNFNYAILVESPECITFSTDVSGQIVCDEKGRKIHSYYIAPHTIDNVAGQFCRERPLVVIKGELDEDKNFSYTIEKISASLSELGNAVILKIQEFEKNHLPPVFIYAVETLRKKLETGNVFMTYASNDLSHPVPKPFKKKKIKFHGFKGFLKKVSKSFCIFHRIPKKAMPLKNSY